MQNGTLLRHTCEFCGKTFYSKRPDSRFDKPSCRGAAFRWRKRLSKHSEQAIKHVKEIATYLSYPDARPKAAIELSVIETEINEIRRLAGIRKVR